MSSGMRDRADRGGGGRQRLDRMGSPIEKRPHAARTEAGSPILVTGSHRSGTTWVGEMLAASGEVGYISEPFNPTRPAGICGVELPAWFFHIPPGAASPDVERALEETLAFRFSLGDVRKRARSVRDYRDSVYWARLYRRYRRSTLRPLLKDPIAVFSAEWLADTFGASVVTLIRHPAAFVRSIEKVGWQYDFENFTRQPGLMDGHLRGFEPEIEAAAARRPDLVGQACLLWRVIYHMVRQYRRVHPEWYFVRQEDLALLR